MNLIGRRRIWYAISLALLIPGVVSLFMNGLKLGIDFRGGSLVEVDQRVDADTVRQAADGLGFSDISVTSTDGGRSLIRYRDDAEPANQEQNHRTFRDNLENQGIQEVRYDVVGPSVSRDITRNALLSIVLASLAIIVYVAFAFRNVPPPVSPWSFGVIAVVALLHDALFVVGLFSIMGVLFGVEVDSLFVTAILTVIGFSVHDTIVVFDRVRENLRRRKGEFAELVNASLLETLSRSLSTSLTVIFTLLALFLFGGTTIRMFVLALLVGMAAGTYSSILTASPLLVTWQEYQGQRLSKAKSKGKTVAR